MTNQNETTTLAAAQECSAPIDDQPMRYRWLPGWYASKLHAVHVGTDLPTGMATVVAKCGQRVFGKAPTDWAQRQVDKGVQRCKRCEKSIGATHNRMAATVNGKASRRQRKRETM